MEHHSVPGTSGVIVVGTGGVAGQHIAALEASSRAHLAGVIDVDAGRARATSHAHGGVPWTVDLGAALEWPDVVGCIVCTPNQTHVDVANQVSAAGKHLLIEKPLAVDVSAAQSIVDVFDKHGLTLTVAHTHRAYEYSRSVKEVIETGDVGAPAFIRFSIVGGWSWGDWRAWVLDPEKSGGHSLHNGVHLLDLATWWMGARPISVYARGSKQSSTALQIYDYFEMVVRYAGGQVAVCEMSRGHRPTASAERDVLVIGTQGTVALPHDGEGSRVVDDRGIGQLLPVEENGFARQLDGWLDAIDGGMALADGADGVLSVAMGVASERSIATGVPVRLDDLLVGAGR